ncbi:RNA polymerase factor sigma-54 [Alysiella crassa]|uniref:RNA polymerase factor sigma-54 n=1 Tax=Alysiella crassa TaxID=153491 RepID=UPI00068C0B06|nr:RNA polymerase factor sigma-54 [Alysiella crassa]UOP07805.1 RNA polymerase factor sigma-54 [Alysiella crassa]
MSANHLHLKLRQTQQLSQNLQYSLRVLQMSGQEMEREVEDWLADNPLLERVSAEDAPLETAQLSAAISQTHRNVGGDDAENAWENIAKEDNLYSYLHAQVCEHPLSELEAAHVHVLIDFLDEHGYLSESVEEIIDNTPLEWHLSEEDIEIAIENLQNFDPAGIATPNLQQSLLHQLGRLPANSVRRCAAQIVNSHLHELKQGNKQNLNLLTKKLPDFDSATIQQALEMISGLNPYPAYGFATEDPTSYINPEVIVKEGKEGWYVVGNDVMFPRMAINTELVDALSQTEQVDSIWKEKAVEAKQKLDILSMRQSTIMRIANYIVEKQQDFFEFGEIGLVPMLLKECAQHLELAESTISRAVNQKYLACPRGVFPMRYFFSQTAVTGEDDEGISQNVIKALIVQIIDSEDKSKPYSDNDLMKMLQRQGITISRRTVAKYRDLLQIAAAGGRRVD